MSLPPRYTGLPGEEQSKYFREVCREFKKAIKSTKEPEELQFEMQRFLDASKSVQWPHAPSEIYHKDEAEKSVRKVWTEFKRYEKALEASEDANPQDLLDALTIVETLVDKLKIR